MTQPFLKIVLLTVFMIGFGGFSEPVSAQSGAFSGLIEARREKLSSNKKKSSSTRSSRTTQKKKTSGSAFGGRTSAQRAADAAARNKAAEAKAKADARKKAVAAAAKKKAASKKAKDLAAKKRAQTLQRLKDEKAREVAAQIRAREDAKRRASTERLRLQQRADADLIAQAQGRRPRGRLFGSRPRPSSSQSGSSGRYLYINQREISLLNPNNSRVEIDLSDQRARVYRGNILVIETQISSGKSGYTTPQGHYSIREKLVEKKSGRYGTWYSASGAKLSGDDSRNPPRGASKFVGADMPYWMRITGGIGMHVGYVPNGPASHGCIRVPPNVQPLIFSKVKVGTPLRIKG